MPTTQEIYQRIAAGDLAGAAGACRARIDAGQTDADTLHLLGYVLHAMGQSAEGEAFVRRALQLADGNGRIHNTLGVILSGTGRDPQAIESFRRAVALEPNLLEALGNLGAAAYRLRRIDESLKSYRAAAALAPREASYPVVLATIYASQGRHEDALACGRRMVELSPERCDYWDWLLYETWFAPGLSGQEIAAEHARWAGRFAAPPASGIRAHANDPSPERRLRIGYVSADLRTHVVGFFMEPILRHHDEERFEVFCYSGGPEDALTQRLRRAEHHWVPTREMSDEQLAERIRADGIDILVDLSLHMSFNRLLVFARRPAPVQATYLGYCGTTGLLQVDYRISDPHLEPADRADGWLGPERIARLPECYWCYRPPPDAPEPAAQAPSEVNGHVTFACGNASPKLNARVARVWARILEQVPNSRLKFVIFGGGENNARTVRMFTSAGIDPSRIEALDFMPFEQYQAFYNTVDVALDPFPYNGGTTTFDALHMGCPVVTLAGELPTARAGVTILSNLGLDRWIARDEEEYVRIAVELARDAAERTEARRTLRTRLLNSHLTDGERFTRQLEDVYRWMWQRWCDGRVVGG